MKFGKRVPARSVAGYFEHAFSLAIYILLSPALFSSHVCAISQGCYCPARYLHEVFSRCVERFFVRPDVPVLVIGIGDPLFILDR